MARTSAARFLCVRFWETQSNTGRSRSPSSARSRASDTGAATASVDAASGITSIRFVSSPRRLTMSSRADAEIAITRSAARADGMALRRVPIVSRVDIASGNRSQIRSSSVTTVATPGATRGVMLASPCRTSRRLRAARTGSAIHWARRHQAEVPRRPVRDRDRQDHPADIAGPLGSAILVRKLAGHEQRELGAGIGVEQLGHDLSRIGPGSASAAHEIEQVQADPHRGDAGIAVSAGVDPKGSLRGKPIHGRVTGMMLGARCTSEPWPACGARSRASPSIAPLAS